MKISYNTSIIIIVENILINLLQSHLETNTMDSTETKPDSYVVLHVIYNLP